MIQPGKSGVENTIIIEWVVNPDQLVKLQEFATNSNHEFYFDSRLHKIAILKRKLSGKWVGWVKIPKAPVLWIGTDENITTPRDTLEIMKMLRGWGIMEHGEVVFAVPHNSKNFTDDLLKRQGAYTLHSNLWIADGYV
jgi:hypothetical protein